MKDNPADFEKLCQSHFGEVLKSVRTAVTQAQAKDRDIHDVLLLGGSTQIPALRKQIFDLFATKPDEPAIFNARKHNAYRLVPVCRSLCRSCQP
jgi:molecular chaperone DnaK (HSP70)